MSAPRAFAVEVRQLSKSFGRIRAVHDLTLEVSDGEIFGFLGLNGAGKTTTIRILLDLVRPTSGSALVYGKCCRRQGLEVRRMIGYLPGEPGLYPEMTGGELLGLFGRMSGAEVRESYREELLERFQLGRADLGRKVRDYSTGMKRKIGLIQAFQHDPPLLVLDEPTEGLDPLMQDALYDLLGALRGRGRTVFMSSHILTEVERLCDRVGLISKGKLILLSTVDGIRKMAPRQVRVVFAEDVSRTPPALAGVEVVGTSAREWRLTVSGTMAPVLRAIEGLSVHDIEIVKPGLDDVLPRFYREGQQ